MRVEAEISSALRRIVRATDLHSRSLLRSSHLTAPQLAVLKEVARRENAPVGLVAKAVHLGAPTTTGIVDRLERRGLVERVRGEKDRRQVNVRVTQAGREMLQQNLSLLNERFRARLAELENWEQTQILATLQRVAAMMEPDEPATDSSSRAPSESHRSQSDENGADWAWDGDP